jgi:hypothetical protein
MSLASTDLWKDDIYMKPVSKPEPFEIKIHRLVKPVFKDCAQLGLKFKNKLRDLSKRVESSVQSLLHSKSG